MNIAIITGASSGMGKEFALQLSKKETFDEIWVIARRMEALQALQAQIACPVVPISLDLCDSRSFDAYEALLKEKRPNVLVLVNAAGFGKFGKWENISLEDCNRMIDLNCKALLNITQLTVPYMKPGSKIVELDSLSAFQPVPFITVYGATKSFVLSYSRAMGRELAPRGIRVMAVSPGWVKTEFFSHAFTSNQSDVQYFNRLYEAKDVVTTAIRDLYHSRKDVSIHGLPVKAQVLGVKLLPHSLIMSIWQNQQKKKKNVPEH